jgi:hypothetical protein
MTMAQWGNERSKPTTRLDRPPVWPPLRLPLHPVASSFPPPSGCAPTYYTSSAENSAIDIQRRNNNGNNNNHFSIISSFIEFFSFYFHFSLVWETSHLTVSFEFFSQLIYSPARLVIMGGNDFSFNII